MAHAGTGGGRSSEESEEAHVRFTAASTLLKFGREGIELDDLAARVETLEAAAEQAAKQR